MDSIIKYGVLLNNPFIMYNGLTNQNLIESKDNGKTNQSTELLDLAVYIN